MKPIEMKDLVLGLLTLIFVSVALGHFDQVERFARREAAKALRPKAVPQFFPSGYGGK